jgi:hypothetical protein
MPLATKNGSLIVKDGLLAENCGCCGGWYCCADKACLAKPSSVTLSVVAEDFYAQYGMADTGGGVSFESSACAFGSSISGTHSLTQIAAEAGYSSTWKKTFSAVPAGCQPVEFVLRLSANSRIAFDFYYTFAVPTFYFASPTRVVSKGEMSCGMSFNSGGGGFPMYENAYYRPYPFNGSQSWPSCSDLPYQYNRSIRLEEYANLYAERSFDAAYGAGVIATRQRIGSDTVSITVSLA